MTSPDTTTMTPSVGTDLPEAAVKVAELAGQAAQAADTNHRLDPAVAESLVDAGFSRRLVPQRWGGNASVPGAAREFAAALTTVGSACMSTAWTGGVLTALSQMCSHLPEEGQRELWGDGPDVPLAGSLSPAGTVRPVDGGWRLSGQWDFASGVDHAQWTTVGGMAPAPGGPPAFRHFLLPKSDYTVRDTWRNVGLCGTGSNSLVVEDVFVPEHRSFTHLDVLAGNRAPDAPRIHQVPLKMINGLFFVTPGIGAVEGALTGWTEWTAHRTEMTRAKTSDRPGVRFALSHAAADLDAARLLVQRAVEAADSGPLDPATTLLSTRDFSTAADLLISSVDGLFRMSGSRGQTQSNPIQRVWRDVHCMAGHAALQPDMNADAWARYALGER